MGAARARRAGAWGLGPRRRRLKEPPRSRWGRAHAHSLNNSAAGELGTLSWGHPGLHPADQAEPLWLLCLSPALWMRPPTSRRDQQGGAGLSGAVSCRPHGSPGATSGSGNSLPRIWPVCASRRPESLPCSAPACVRIQDGGPGPPCERLPAPLPSYKEAHHIGCFTHGPHAENQLSSTPQLLIQE